jgi:hypothetical protein
LYRGLRSGNGAQLYPGFVPGGEAGPGGWGPWISGVAAEKSLEYAFGTQGNAYLIFQNPTYDYRKFNVDRDVKAADSRAGQTLNATDPDLREFQKRGGKLILYHGWSDPALPPNGTIDYYRSVVGKVGQRNADAFVRLYMVPGMQHCERGPGADNFGVLPGTPPRDPDPKRNLSTALERWVEEASAPSAIVATKYNNTADPASGVTFTRLLCPYPSVAKYKGSGNTSEADNYICKSARN